VIALVVSKSIKIHGALIIVTLLYSANYSIAKFALPEYLEPFGFIVMRIFCAGALFWVFSFKDTREPIRDKKDYWLILICAFFGVAQNQLLFFKGLSRTTPINASVIMTTSPVVVMLTAYFLGREKLTAFKIIGVIVAGLGAYLLLTKDGVSLTEGNFLGDLFILLNGSSYAVYLVLVKPLMLKYRPVTVIKWMFLFGGIMALPFGIEQLIAVQWNTLPSTAWLSIIYVVVGATFLVYLLNVWALQFVNSSVVGIYIYIQPVFATLIAMVLRDDILELDTVTHSILIMVGVYLVSYKKGTSSRPSPQGEGDL